MARCFMADEEVAGGKERKVTSAGGRSLEHAAKLDIQIPAVACSPDIFIVSCHSDHRCVIRTEDR